MASRQLVIYHHVEASRRPDKVVHHFIVGRMQFTADELAKAPIVEVPEGRSAASLSRRTTPKGFSLRFPFVSFSYGSRPSDGLGAGNVLELGSFYPYPRLTDRRLAPIAHEKLVEGGRGLGTVFGHRVFRFLTGVYPSETPIVLDIGGASAPLQALLNRAALARGGRGSLSTLGDHVEGFDALARGRVHSERGSDSSDDWRYGEWWKE